MSADPSFMSLMNFFYVLKIYAFFSFSISFLDSLETKLRWTLQINYSFKRQIFHYWFTKWVVYSIFYSFKISFFVHNLSKNMSVRQRRSLWKEYFIFISFDSFFPKSTPRMKSIQLKSKSPAFWILIISLKNVITSSVFPLIHRFFNSISI